MSRARSLSRRYALQALYQWQLNPQSVTDILAQFANPTKSRTLLAVTSSISVSCCDRLWFVSWRSMGS